MELAKKKLTLNPAPKNTRIQDGLVVINQASHLWDPGSTLGSHVGGVSIDLYLAPMVFLRVLSFSSLLKNRLPVNYIWLVLGAPRSHMDRMAPAVRRLLTCIRSYPVEPVDPKKPL